MTDPGWAVYAWKPLEDVILDVWAAPRAAFNQVAPHPRLKLPRDQIQEIAYHFNTREEAQEEAEDLRRRNVPIPGPAVARHVGLVVLTWRAALYYPPDSDPDTEAADHDSGHLMPEGIRITFKLEDVVFPAVELDERMNHKSQLFLMAVFYSATLADLRRKMRQSHPRLLARLESEKLAAMQRYKPVTLEEYNETAYRTYTAATEDADDQTTALAHEMFHRRGDD
jgi:hypothetical protein